MMSKNMPEVLVDITSQDTIEDPVTDEDGHIYSRSCITDWIETCQLGNISPTTGCEMRDSLTDHLKSTHTGRDEEASGRDVEIDNMHCEGGKNNVSPQDSGASDIIRDHNAGRNGVTVISSLSSLPGLSHLTQLLGAPPSACVCLAILGAPSSGKSSLLEGLLEGLLPPLFSRGVRSGLLWSAYLDSLLRLTTCTVLLSPHRVPVKVQLRPSATPCPPSLALISPDPSLSLPPRQYPPEELAAAMIDLLSHHHGEEVSWRGSMAVIYLEAPLLPAMDLVELPGIVPQTISPSEPPDMQEHQQQSVMEMFMAAHPEAVYLAVLQEGSSCSCRELIQEHSLQVGNDGMTPLFCHYTVVSSPSPPLCTDLPQNKAFGVMRKCDSLSGSSLGNWRAVALEKCKEGGEKVLCEGSEGNEEIGAVSAGVDRLCVWAAGAEWVPEGLQLLRGRLDSLAAQSSALGEPSPPILPHAENVEARKVNKVELDGFKTALTIGLKTIILEAKELGLHRAYAKEVLEPLSSSVLATSTGTHEFLRCLSPSNSVEKWLCSLRRTISAICEKSVERAVTFWGDALESLLMRDESALRIARFRNLITRIKLSVCRTMEQRRGPLLEEMNAAVMRLLSAVNLFQGASVRYDFSGEQEKVTLCWESDALASTLVHHLVSKAVLTPEVLFTVAVATMHSPDEVESLTEVGQKRKLGLSSSRLEGRWDEEVCAEERSRLRQEAQLLEDRYRAILTTLVKSRREGHDALMTIDEHTSPNTVTGMSPYNVQLKASGLGLAVLLRHRFPVESLLQGGYSAAELLAGGVVPARLHRAGCSLTELRKCEVGLSVLIGQAVLEKKSVLDLVLSGYSFRELEDFGFDFVLLLGTGCREEARRDTLRALLALDLNDDERRDLLNRELIAAVLAYWIALCPEVEEDGGLLVSEKSKREIDFNKEVILEVFCKFYGGSPDLPPLSLTEHLISSLANLQSCTGDTDHSALLCMRALRLMGEGDPAAGEVLMKSPALCSRLAVVLSEAPPVISDAVKLEGLLLLKSVCMTDNNHPHQCAEVLEQGWVNLLWQIAACPVEEGRDGAVQRVATFVLCLLAGRGGADEDLGSMNGASPGLVVPLLSHVVDMTASCLDDTVDCIFAGMSRFLKVWRGDGDGLCGGENLLNAVVGWQRWDSASRNRNIIDIMRHVLSSLPTKKCGCATEPLTRLLLTEDPQTNQEAVTLLLQLVETSSEHKHAIAKAGGVASLVKMLAPSRSLQCKLAAASLLIPLAAEPAISAAVVHQGETVDRLLDMLHEEGPGCKEAAAATMRALAYVEENRGVMAEEGALDPLICILAGSEPPSCQLMAARTLRNLAFNCTDNKLAVANLGGIPPLVAMLQHSHATGDAGKVASAGVLQNLAHNMPDNVRLIVAAGALPLLKEIMLNDSCSSAAKEAAAGVVRNIASDNPSCLSVYRSGTLEALIGMMQDKNYSGDNHVCRQAARDALRTIARNDQCRTNIKLAGIGRKDINYKHANW